MFIVLESIKNKYKLQEEQVIFFSLIFLLFIAGIFNTISENIFIVSIFYWIAKMTYISNFLGKDYFSNKKDIKISLIIMISAFLINKYIINEVDNIFLSPSEYKTIIWIFIFIYIYKFINNKSINNKEYDELEEKCMLNKKSIVMNYAKFKLKFDDEITNIEPLVRLVIYTIMIYENYNRPLIIRKLDNLMFKINNTNKKLGIMQIKSKKLIDDVDSIRIVCKKIELIYNKKSNPKNKKEDIGLLVLNGYYKKLNDNTEFIYEVLKEFNNL